MTGHIEQHPVTVGANEGDTPWLTVKDAAARARCGVKTIYRAAENGKLKAARIDGRRSLRFLAEWVDDWLRSSVTIH